MTTAVRPNTYDPSTWEWEWPGKSQGLKVPVCPSCVVLVPESKVEEHITKMHPATLYREAITHLTSSHLDGVVIKGFFNAPYREQLAAIHAQEGWRPEDVEKVMSTIYQAKQTGRLDVLESTWELTQRVALDWFSTDGSPV